MSLRDDLMAANTVPWIMGSQFVTENRRPFEFYNHRFLLEYLADDHRHKVSKKSSQIGETVGELFDDFHLAIKRHMNVIHTLHTNDVLKGFVQPKVDPIILLNPELAQYGTGSQGLKTFDGNFVYFRGANSESQAISISADVLKIDEKDRSDPHVVEMFESRLDFSEYKWIREFSNPSSVGFGVDATYGRSDQRHWFVQCHHCNYRSYIDFGKDLLDISRDAYTHYVDQNRLIFACGKCNEELSTADRTNGEWVAKFPSNDKIHGYWFSQMMAPWFTAAEIVDKYQQNSIEYFHNFVLGKAYTPADMIVNRETILRACAPSTIQKLGVVIGVDQNANEQIWVAGTLQGIFAHGRTKSWEEFEHLKLMWNATVVSDPNPYPTMPKKYAEKYPDWYLCYFKPHEGIKFVTWKNKTVFADRTRLLDTVANEITTTTLLFREHAYALEDYIADWANIYRTTVEKENGQVKSEWLKKEGKNSDYSFATAYMRLGLSRQINSGSTMLSPGNELATAAPVTYLESNRGSLGPAVDDTLERMN